MKRILPLSFVSCLLLSSFCSIAFDVPTSKKKAASIPKRPLTVSLVASPIISKIYDGSTIVTLASANYKLNGVETGDDVTVAGTAHFIDKNAGTGKKIIVDAFVLSGADKDNYELVNESTETTGNITSREIDVMLLSESDIKKVYDGTDTMYVDSLKININDVVPGDQIWVGGIGTLEEGDHPTTKYLTYHDVELKGADRLNYTKRFVYVSLLIVILPRPIVVTTQSGTVISKVYDGTAHLPSVEFIPQGVVAGDDADVIFDTAYYEDEKAGIAKSVKVFVSGITGVDKDKYFIQEPIMITGDITPKSLTVSALSGIQINKLYDGNKNAILQDEYFSASPIIYGDEVSFNYPSLGSYDTKNVGENKNVKIIGISIAGPDAANYQLQNDSLIVVGNILPKEIKVAALPQTKSYGSVDPPLAYTVEGILEGDLLKGSLERVTGSNVGRYSILQGALAAENYIISEYIPAELAITSAPLTITAENKTKNEGNLNPDFTFRYEGFVNGDTLSALSSLPVAATAAVSGSPAGEYDINVSGAVAGNYAISYIKGILSVLPIENNNDKQVHAWSVSRSTLQVSIQSDVPQRAAIILYSFTGQPMVIEQKNLGAGNNNYTLPVRSLSAGTYTLRVKAEKFKSAQRVNLK